MSRLVPEVVAGARDGVNTGRASSAVEVNPARSESARAVQALRVAADIDAHGETETVVFQSGSPTLVVLLAPGFSKRNPETGAEEGERPRALKFQYGICRESDPKTVRLARKHAQFGIGMLFWEAKDLVARAEQRQREDTLAAIKRDPQLVQALLRDLGVDELSVIGEPKPKAEVFA